MKKVILPREVAEAIENIRMQGFENCNIVRAVTHSNPPYDDVDLERLIAFANRNFDDLIISLAAGYEVEKTPEEIIRDDYEQFDPGTLEYRAGLRDGIVRTLNTLGIKIEGVNA